MIDEISSHFQTEIDLDLKISDDEADEVFDKKEVASPIDIPKGRLNSEWIFEVIISPKIPTKNVTDFFPERVGQKSEKFLVGILGETMISSIHSEFNWPLKICPVEL